MKGRPSGRKWKRAFEVLLYASSPVLSLVAAPLLARVLGPADRGVLAVAMAASAFAVSLGAAGQADLLSADLRIQPAFRQIRYAVGVASSLVAAVVCFWALLLLT